jgi:hypothetical protein
LFSNLTREAAIIQGEPEPAAIAELDQKKHCAKRRPIMQLRVRLIVGCLLVLFAASLLANAQPATGDYKISRARFTNFPKDKYVDIRFTDPLDQSHTEDLAATNVQIESLPSNTAITVENIGRVFGSPRDLRVTVSAGTSTPATDDKLQVCFAKLNFLDAAGKAHPTTAQVCSTGDVVTPSNVGDKLEQQFQILQQTPKTSDEKNIFASGFAAKGNGNKTDGGAQINLNSNDLGIAGLFVSLHLDKTTALNADPKYFEAALTYRSTYLFGASGADETRKQLAIIRDPKSSPEQVEAAGKEVDRLTAARQRMLLGAWLFDVGANLEGEALNFNVTNFVGTATLALQSRTKKLFGSKNGYWKFRLIPAGVEGGTSLNKDAAAQQAATPQQKQALQDVNYVARLKFGGSFTLFYDNEHNHFLFKRVEWDTRGVDRYLFLNEVRFDDTTKMNVLTDKGNKPWFQTDVKFFLASNPTGRIGFKISYSRGSLPPVFANTNSFQYGFVVETADDTKK